MDGTTTAGSCIASGSSATVSSILASASFTLKYSFCSSVSGSSCAFIRPLILLISLTTLCCAASKALSAPVCTDSSIISMPNCPYSSCSSSVTAGMASCNSWLMAWLSSSVAAITRIDNRSELSSSISRLVRARPASFWYSISAPILFSIEIREMEMSSRTYFVSSISQPLASIIC